MARSIFFYTDSRTFGGAEQALLTLIAGLDRRAWQPTLMVDDVPEVAALVQRISEHRVPVRFVEPMPLGLQGARRVPRFARVLRAEQPDIFHAHLSWPLAAKYPLVGAVAARTRVVVATLHLIPDFKLDRSSFLQLRALSAGVGCYIAVSRNIAAELVTRFRWPERKLRVIHNGVAAERFEVTSPPALREMLTNGRSTSVVLACGRLHPQKAHLLLLEAAAQLPEAVFIVVGDGPLRGALETRAAALGLADRFHLLGFRDDVPELLAASDVFTAPSYYEGASLSVLEAMAAGRAIVSSRIGGTNELIEDEQSGLLVAPGDVDALVAALRRVLADETLRATLGVRARERVRREFTATAMVRRTVRVYEEQMRHSTNP